MKRFVIFDIDGTVADNQWRHAAYDAVGVPTYSDYHKYIRGIPLDKPIEPVVQICRMFLESSTHQVHFFTGRYVEEESLTLDWLRLNVWPSMPKSRLNMRPEKFGEPDVMNDAGWKIKWANELTGYHLDHILCVFDDRNYVVQAWRDAGVYCIQPQLGDF